MTNPTIRIQLQDPNWSKSEYLLERLLGACRGAFRGSAAFAFATVGGVRLLLEDSDFEKFLTRGQFDLIIGVDAVTNCSALDRLMQCSNKFPNLTVRALWNQPRVGLFHNKICWFEDSRGILCFTGSGNLTPGGLRGNIEAFAETRLKQPHQRTLDRGWKAWLRYREGNLLPLDDARIRACASRNTAQAIEGDRRRRSVVVENRQGQVLAGAIHTASDCVLIAQIPRSGKRWNQANFDLDTFKHFFGAKPGHTQRIILTHIGKDGRPTSHEVRPSVAVKSHNFRFELEAASGLPYPRHGRPIAIFLRVAVRTFRYRLIMPGAYDYVSVWRYLRSHTEARGKQMRRTVTTAGALRNEQFYRPFEPAR